MWSLFEEISGNGRADASLDYIKLSLIQPLQYDQNLVEVSGRLKFGRLREETEIGVSIGKGMLNCGMHVVGGCMGRNEALFV